LIIAEYIFLLYLIAIIFVHPYNKRNDHMFWFDSILGFSTFHRKGVAMQAAFYEQTGPAADVFSVGDIPAPVPGRGEVRVKVAWSGVNPSDVKSRSSTRTKSLPFPRVIPHSDGSGVIDQVGPDIASTRVGERVWVWNAAWMRPFGTAAEYVVLPSEQVVPLPLNTDLAVGACLGIPALTAYHAITADGGVTDKDVLVAGGAGAVGHYAIQLARIKGARRVIATVSGPEKAALAREAGADIILNYRTDDLSSAILDLTQGQGVDRIVEVDLAANIGTDISLLRPGGEVVVYGSGAPEINVPFSTAIRKGLHLYFFIVYNLTSVVREAAIADLTKLMEEERLIHNIAARLPLTEIAEAHNLVEQGRVIGNVILQVE
jgi:NADPH:quinone reductase